MIRNCVKESSQWEVRRLKGKKIAREDKRKQSMPFDNGNSSREPNIMCVYRKNNKWNGALFYPLHRLQSTQMEYTNDKSSSIRTAIIRWVCTRFHITTKYRASSLSAEEPGEEKINVFDLSSLWRLKHIGWSILFGVRAMSVIWVARKTETYYRYEMSSWALHLSQISFSC